MRLVGSGWYMGPGQDLQLTFVEVASTRYAYMVTVGGSPGAATDRFSRWGRPSG